ncbi:MAG TPA: hypothetical protein VFQ12_03005 [Thermoleophilaceae bacterium]|nr:hypothetical protein [Thermoleophilaceae bacterium]
MIATIVDTSDLLEVVWISLVAAVGVTGAYATAVLGAGRALDYGRDGQRLRAAGFGVLGAVAAAIVVAGIVFGIVAMTDK